MPRHEVNRIRYFTALVRNRSSDPTQAQRQQAYIRALQTIPKLSIHYGRFLESTKRMPLSSPAISGPQTVEVLNTEEKGSDVNLATYLLLDAFDNDSEMAVVISNDSDLQLPIQLTREKLGKIVGVIDPSGRHSFQLNVAASWYRSLRKGSLGVSLFPDTVTDAHGTIAKPAGW